MAEKPLFETNPPKELNFDTDELTNNFEEFIGLSLGVVPGKKLKLGRYNKVGLSDIALEFQWEKITLINALTACARIGFLDMGRKIHGLLIRNEIVSQWYPILTEVLKQ